MSTDAGHNRNSEPKRELSVTLGSELQLQIDGVSGRLKSVLVGMLPDKYLIIQGPFGSIKDILFRGKKIVVRYIHEGTVFGFRAELIRAVFDPITVLFITYPNTIETYELRFHKRINCFLPAELIVNNQKHSGIMLDLSEGGCRCLLKASKDKEMQTLEINEQVSMRFELPGMESKQTISGELKNVQRDIEEIRLGVRFHELTPGVRNRIAEYISTLERL